MSNRCQKINKEEIPVDVAFEGYLWCSDRPGPEILMSELIDHQKFSDLPPFIVEGNLYSEAEAISIQIKNIDGAYQIIKIDLSDLENIDHTDQIYLSHRVNGFNRFRMIEAWEETEDESVDKATVLEPAWSAFAGFIKK